MTGYVRRTNLVRVLLVLGLISCTWVSSLVRFGFSCVS
jgi:hypothetical protein